MRLIVDKKLYFFGNLETLLMALMASLMPFKLNLGNAAIILGVLYALILLVKKKVPIINFKVFYFIVPVILFFISVVSALTSKDIIEGVHQLEKLLLMVLIPFIFCAFKKRDINVFKVLYTFSLGVTLATVILLVINCIKVFKGMPTEELFFFNFTKLYDQHPVYFSTNIALSIFFLIQHFIVKKSKVIPMKWVYLILLIHVLGLVFCASKAVIFCFLVLLFFYIITNREISRRLMLVTLSLLFMGTISVFCVPQLKGRFVEGLTYSSNEFTPTKNLLEAKKFTYEEKTNISDLELRFIFLKIGLYHTVEDEKVLFGYGLGDVQNYLDYYYMTYNLAPNWYEGFNLHNQYLQYLVTYGIFVLLLFVFYLLYSLVISIKTKNIMHIFFMLMILFVFTFEVYLVRNKGIVLLFFFNTFFSTQKFRFEDSNFRH